MMNDKKEIIDSTRTTRIFQDTIDKRPHYWIARILNEHAADVDAANACGVRIPDDDDHMLSTSIGLLRATLNDLNRMTNALKAIKMHIETSAPSTYGQSAVYHIASCGLGEGE